MEPSDVSKSRTFVSNEVETTVNMEDWVKHARKRPFGANDSATMGEDMRARQSTSVISAVTALTTTTELSDVDKKTSGCLDFV